MKGRIEFEFNVLGPTDECWREFEVTDPPPEMIRIPYLVEHGVGAFVYRLLAVKHGVAVYV